jgi:hypothetical protein
LALIPICRGASLSFIGRLGYRLSNTTSEELITTLHASPEDTLLISRDVRARHSVVMHCATFAGGEYESLEPLVRLVEGREKVLWFEKSRGGWEAEGGFGASDDVGGGDISVSDRLPSLRMYGMPRGG